MNEFILRIPTKEDLSFLQNTLSIRDIQKLHLNEAPKFHIKDQPSSDLLSLRPVLESKNADMYSIRNGTRLDLGHHLIVDLPVGTPQLPVCWVKCGNLLVADDCTPELISYTELEKHGLTDGIAVEVPFDKAVSLMFYEEAMHHPISFNRSVGQIMTEVRYGIDDNPTEEDLTVDELYTVAVKLYDEISYCNTEERAAIQSVGNLLRNGINSFSWCDEHGKYQSSTFSPAAAKHALLTCENEAFGHLINIGSDDPSGYLSRVGRDNCLAALREGEKAHQQHLSSLDDLISRACAALEAQEPQSNTPSLEAVR